MNIDIPGYPGYKLTENFKVIGKTGKVLKENGKTHKYVNVYVNNQSNILYVHRAVALVHVNGYFPGAWVDHIDDNSLNNDPSNLKWVTAKVNNYKNKPRKSTHKDTPHYIKARISHLKNRMNEINEQIKHYQKQLNAIS